MNHHPLDVDTALQATERVYQVTVDGVTLPTLDADDLDLWLDEEVPDSAVAGSVLRLEVGETHESAADLHAADWSVRRLA